MIEPICASNIQVWSAFRCKVCPAKGLLATTLSLHAAGGSQTVFYRWAADSVIVRLFLRTKLED